MPPEEWRKIIKHLRRLTLQQNRAHKKITDRTVTPDATLALFHRQNGKCAICKFADLRFDHSLDHIIPRRHGGRHTLLNLQWTCKFCNYAKQADRIPRHPPIDPAKVIPVPLTIDTTY